MLEAYSYLCLLYFCFLTTFLSLLIMENSVSSSPNRVISPSKSKTDADDLAEESGWTQYVEDFSAYNKEGGAYTQQENHSYSGCCSSFVSTASMVSDAGSGPEWKKKNINNLASAAVCSSIGGLPNMPKRLNFKNKRAQEIPFDDSLEDTASSPVNSPKITMCFKRMDINSRKMDNDSGSHMANEISIDQHVEYDDINSEHNLNNSFHNHIEYVDLKKRGLRLVPISMITGYLD
ncbi:vascular-related unknown protein 1 [Beta vulgaris subsp. vulgaris]|uniref:vascular-related unknown protein 1 n=1 Tax=Beta vulgaris subsp. vulgaris TaxID=3555 RepID=UPI0020374A02|nr:vascular-related unknown protein 1 [Beta vulgaris subsp. vulgaris]